MKFKTNFLKAMSLSFFLSLSICSQTSWFLGGNSPVLNGDYLGTIANSDLEFRTNSIPAMTISGLNQSVGINTTTQAGRLGVEENNGVCALSVRNYLHLN